MSHYQATIQTWNTLADAYEQKFMDLDLYNDTYDRLLELLPKPDAAVLEIGCGPGNITRYLLAKSPELKVTATDVAPAMLQLAKNNAPAANFLLLDAREISNIKEQFDGIVCGFCMPYLTKQDCANLIAEAANLLSATGILYLSTLEGEYDKSDYQTGSNGQQLFVYMHQENYLLEFLKKSGFEVVEVSRKQYPQTAPAMQIHLILIARKSI